MTKKLFTILSYLLHPVFMPLVGVILIFSMSHLALLPGDAKRAIIYLIVIVTVFFPLAIIPVLYLQKALTGIEISKRNERLLPLFITSVFYFLAYYILHRYAVPLIIQHFLLGVFICVSLASFIHIGWKISLHMVGIGGIIGLLSALSNIYGLYVSWVFMLCILSAGLVGTARLYLKEHNTIQVYAGFIMGYVLNFGVILIFNL